MSPQAPTCWFATTWKGEQVRVVCEDRPDAAWIKAKLRELGYLCTSTEDGAVCLSPREIRANLHFRELTANTQPG